MTKEETTATWQCWLLDAIHKIRYQKQRPNVERVAACIRMHHPQYSNEAVEEHLEQCVKNGSITKVGIHNTNTIPSDFTKKAFKDTMDFDEKIFFCIQKLKRVPHNNI